MGWLEKHGEHPADAQTLAWFADVRLLNRYIKWYLNRSVKCVHGGHLGFISFALSLVHPDTGYLTQCGDLRLQLPGDISEQQWSGMCQSVFTQLNQHKKQLQRVAVKSRDPNDAVDHILQLEDPLLALEDMRNRMRADRPTAGTYTEAVWGRDLAMVSLMYCSPIRAKNMKHLQYHHDLDKHLRRRKNGSWELFIPRSEFKNCDGAAKDRDYCIELDSSIYPELEAYLKVYRPILLRGNIAATDLLFVTTQSGLDDEPWEALNRRFEVLTKKYLMRCPGVGPHAIRHIVATAIVKKTGEFNTAALVLHDKEETVRKNYSHLLSDDGHVRYRKLFPNLFKS